MVSPTGDADVHPYVAVPASKSGETVYVYLDPEVAEALPGKLSIGSHGYAQIFADGRVMLLHRWIMKVPHGTRYGIIVDHINRDILDCRRSNMRLVSPTESNLNRKHPVRDLPLGVYVDGRTGRFVAKLKRRRVSAQFGSFGTIEEAAARVREVLANPELFERAVANRIYKNRITLDQADEIRALFAGGTTQRELALKFGVSQSYVNNIIRGKSRLRKAS